MRTSLKPPAEYFDQEDDMKRMLTAVVMALCLLAWVGASATRSAGNGPPNSDKVDGTVEDIFPSTLHVGAISDPDGSNARGQMWYTADNPGFTVDVAGEVTCLNVVGSNATIGMKIDRSKLPGFPGTGNGFLFYVSDYGEPGDMDSHLDVPLNSPPLTCPPPIVFLFPQMHGNFIVRDAP